MNLLEALRAANDRMQNTDDALIYRLIQRYDERVAHAKGIPLYFRRPKRFLRDTPIWQQFADMVMVARANGADPAAWLEVQFEEFRGAQGYPYPPMLSSNTAALRWSWYRERTARQFAGSYDEAGKREEERADPLAGIRKALSVGEEQWKTISRLGEPTKLILEAPGILPTAFLFTLPTVLSFASQGFLPSTVQEEYARLRNDAAAWGVIMKWKREHGR